MSLSVGDILEPYDERLGRSEEPEILTLTEKKGFVPQREKFNKRVAIDDTSKYKVVRRNDVAFNPYLLWAGAIATNRQHERAIISPAYPTFRIRDGFDPSYVDWLLSGEPIRLRYDSISFGAVPRRRRAATEAFLSINIGEVPPLPEQKRIAKILDAADALRAKRRESLAQLDALLQSTFLEMFGDPVENPKGWKIASLPAVVAGKYGIKAGPFGSSLKKEDYVSSGFRVYGQEQVIAGRFDIGDYYIDEQKFSALKNCAISPGDILVSLVGSFGKVLVVPEGVEPGIINPRLLKISPLHDQVRSTYLAHFLQNPGTQKELERMSHGGTMGILNAGLLKRLQIPVPPMRTQARFEHAITNILDHKQRYIAQAEALSDLFAALQHSAFAGQL